MNPPEPTLRAETQTDPTVPPLPVDEGGEATAEPEDPSAELLRRVLAGSREPDVSRVKLAKMPAPTGSHQLCWKDAPFREKLNVTCCQERDQVRGLPGVVWRLR